MLFLWRNEPTICKILQISFVHTQQEGFETKINNSTLSLNFLYYAGDALVTILLEEKTHVYPNIYKWLVQNSLLWFKGN